MRDRLEVWEQLKRQLIDDPRFIVGSYVGRNAIEVFIKNDDKLESIKMYIREITKDVAEVSERGKRTLSVELKPDAEERKIQERKEECDCAND
jgi:hypothetical protein